MASSMHKDEQLTQALLAKRKAFQFLQSILLGRAIDDSILQKLTLDTVSDRLLTSTV